MVMECEPSRCRTYTRGDAAAAVAVAAADAAAASATFESPTLIHAQDPRELARHLDDERRRKQQL